MATVMVITVTLTNVTRKRKEPDIVGLFSFLWRRVRQHVQFRLEQVADR